ncbi:hypothetical protein DXG01_013031 [Tephrocybe rancida]|nr:hypothetical protein DXG01_013031 [Tephrocybe rancida]
MTAISWFRQATLQQFGISVKLVITNAPADFAAAIDSNTKAMFVESISQANFVIPAIRDLADVAHKAKIPLIVDNTLGMAGYLMRPIDHGADIVVESITKWINGHGLALGGVIIDSGRFLLFAYATLEGLIRTILGNFDWKQSDKYPGLSKSSTGHHTYVYADAFGPIAFATKLRADILRDLGPSLEPFSAFFMLQGLETLSLRAEKQCGNAFALAKWLENHVKVTSVSYLGLESHNSHVLAKSYLKEGMYGAVLSFTLKGGASAAETVMRNVSLASRLDSFGDTKTLVFRHTGMSNAQPQGSLANGLSGQEGVRVSVGIEAMEDIIADFAVALDLLN